MQYVFGAYTLDTLCYELRRAEGVIPLDRQGFTMLVYLIQHRNRVVLRQELFDHVWPDRFVSDASLEQCMAVVRRAVGDSGRAQRVIQTVHGRGYRFVADVHEGVDHARSDPRQSPPPTTSASAEDTQDSMAPPSSAIPLGQFQEEMAPHAALPPAPACPAEKSADPPSVPQGTYKPVTVLCGTLVGLTTVAEQLGLEIVQRLRQAFLARVARAVHRYEGTFQPFGDDGFLALFGVPVAQEDHAQRALRTALSVQQAPGVGSAEHASPHDVALTVRQGLHTGRGMVRRDRTGQQRPVTVIAETTDVAVRLQCLAEPGALLASAATMQLMGEETQSDVFGLVHLGEPRGPMMVYKVLDVRARPRERARRPFVGRERELTALHALLVQSQCAQGQVVGIVGEPGMGKSRLLEAFCHSLDGRQVTYVEGHCRSYGKALPYLPVIGLVQGICGIQTADGRELKTASVRQTLAEVNMNPEEETPYLLQLLDVATHPEPSSRLTPEAMRRRLFKTLRQLFLRKNRQQCLIVAVENLHWIDPTSEAFLTSLVDDLGGSPLMCLVTYRPGYRAPWLEKSYATQMVLQPLTPQDSRAVVQAVDLRAQLSHSLTQLIVEKAEGNPFFLEELTQAVTEQDAAREAVTLPETIRGVLMARIDQLPEATKRVLQTAAVLGREVRSRLLALVWAESDALAPHLQTLKRLEFLRAQPAGDDSVYVFKHALTHEVAYGG